MLACHLHGSQSLLWSLDTPTQPAAQLPKWSLFLLAFPTSPQAESRPKVISFLLPLRLSLLQALSCPRVSLVKMVASCSVFASRPPAFSSDDHHIKEYHTSIPSWFLGPFPYTSKTYSYSCMAQAVMSESTRTLWVQTSVLSTSLAERVLQFLLYLSL